MKQPLKRSRLRLRLGKAFFTLRRYINWYITHKKFARVRHTELLPHVHFEHKTPLYRKLKKVDMWLQDNKVVNLQIAASNLNGTIIRPGETFSYWRLIGKTSRHKGYKTGLALFCGTLRHETGGGLCQLSNLIYWMTLHSPLTVTERYRHSYDVFPDSQRTQPFGSGATCVYPYRDLQITNTTNCLFQLEISIDGTYLCGRWRSNYTPLYRYEVYEKEHFISHEFWGGYVRHNALYRKIWNSENILINDEYITENHAIMMYQPYLSERNETSETSPKA